MDFLWDHYREGTAIQTCVAVFIVLSAIMLLRRKSWTRVVVQILSAVFLAWAVYFCIWWVRSLTVTTSDSVDQHLVAWFRILMSVGGVIMMGLFAFAFGTCIWILEKPAVKEEFRNWKQTA